MLTFYYYSSQRVNLTNNVWYSAQHRHNEQQTALPNKYL